MPAAGDPSPVLRAQVLLPPADFGGERDALAAAVADTLRPAGVTVQVPDGGARRGGSAGVAVAAFLAARRDRPTHVLCFHPRLAPVATALKAFTGARVVVFACGSDVGGIGPAAGLALRRMPCRIVATDGAAGTALSARFGPVSLLRPGVDHEVYHRLLSAEPSSAPDAQNPPALLTVAPLDSAERSGVSTLLRAAELVRARHPDLTVTVAGPGRPSEELTRLLNERSEWAAARTSTTLEDMVTATYRAHVFVATTRRAAAPRRGQAGGELGLGLVEAQLAAVPVVAPASGAAGDAFVEGLTGVRPADDTPEALAAAIRSFLDDPRELARASRNARLWAADAYMPHRFADAVRSVVLGSGTPTIDLSGLTFVARPTATEPSAAE